MIDPYFDLFHGEHLEKIVFSLLFLVISDPAFATGPFCGETYMDLASTMASSGNGYISTTSGRVKVETLYALPDLAASYERLFTMQYGQVSISLERLIATSRSAQRISIQPRYSSIIFNASRVLRDLDIPERWDLFFAIKTYKFPGDKITYIRTNTYTYQDSGSALIDSVRHAFDTIADPQYAGLMTPDQAAIILAFFSGDTSGVRKLLQQSPTKDRIAALRADFENLFCACEPI